MKKRFVVLLFLAVFFLSCSLALCHADSMITLYGPELPITVAGYDFGDTDLSAFKITDVEYSIKNSYSDRYNLDIKLSGKKTYDADGDTNIRFSYIRVDLYDQYGLRVASDRISTGGAWVDKSLYFASCTFYSLPPAVYTLVFTDEINEPLPFLPGDVNGDGIVNGRDVLRLARYLAGNHVSIDLYASDLNGDIRIDGRDLLRLCKFLAGI